MNRDSKAKHTAGPWRHSPQKGKKGHCYTAQVWDNTGQSLAIIEDKENADEATANARLIAASPEMYEMLKSCLAFVDVLDLHGIAGDWSERPKLVELIKKIEG